MSALLLQGHRHAGPKVRWIRPERIRPCPRKVTLKTVTQDAAFEVVEATKLLLFLTCSRVKNLTRKKNNVHGRFFSLGGPEIELPLILD